MAATAFGYWVIVLGAITWIGAITALAENAALVGVLATLAAGSTLLAVGLTASINSLVPIGGLVLVASAVLAFYTAAAMVLESTFGRSVLPVGQLRAAARPAAPAAGARLPRQFSDGEPGVKTGP